MGYKRIKIYFKQLFRQLHLSYLQQKQTYPYKVIGKEECQKTGVEKLCIQVAGKNVFLYFVPQELVKDEEMLNGFSPLDVRTITYMALEKLEQGRSIEIDGLYKIEKQYFSDRKEKEMFVFRYQDKDKSIARSAQELTCDSSFIKNFNSLDANRIGYIAGYEQALIDNKLHKSSKSDKIEIIE